MYQKSWWYDLQFLRYRVCQTEIGNYMLLWSLWSFFTLLPPSPKNQKNQNFEKKKKIAGDTIILHTCVPQMMIIWCMVPEIMIYGSLQMCTKNHNHMMYASYNMECNTHSSLSFWTIFWPFTPLTTQKIIIFKKWKKCLCLEISSFHTSVP